ncbi:UDP-N-acetylmuramate dehydrogenase [Vreelandella sp. EE22]
MDLTFANTLNLPCRAAFGACPATVSELQAVLGECAVKKLPIMLLGGGSNVLLPERFEGVALSPAFDQWWIETQGTRATAYVGAGVNWHYLVMTLARRGWWGIENLALIPGVCGAAPVQNIGAYGVELQDVLEGVEVVELATGRVVWLTASACGFGYRDSIFKKALSGKVAIIRLAIRLTREGTARLGYGDLSARVSASPSSLEVARAVCAIRQEKLPAPALLANAGSFFKNPVVTANEAETLRHRYPTMPCFPQAEGGYKLAAGWLIDQCGLKGARQGAFGVHTRQALVIVHFGGGTRSELLAFSRYVIQTVFERFGVTLEPEPRLV